MKREFSWFKVSSDALEMILSPESPDDDDLEDERFDFLQNPK
jgi:hypothetical protein